MTFIEWVEKQRGARMASWQEDVYGTIAQQHREYLQEYPMSKYADKLPEEESPKCPKCGGAMQWKYQDKPRCVSCEAGDEGGHTEINRATGKPVTMRATRYVYHVSGHAKLHDPNPAHHTHLPEANGPVVPFEVVLRQPFAIDSDEAMEGVRQDVRGHVVEQLEAQGSPYIVGDVMIRNVSKLHRILVDSDNTEGPAARIMS